MKRLILAAAAGLLMNGVAMAADAPMESGAPMGETMMAEPGVTYDWTGLFVGIQAGWAQLDLDRQVTGGGFANSYRADGGFGGVHGGYNWQFNNWVIGLEADFDLADINGNDAGAGGTTDTTEVNWMAAATVKAGLAINRVLVYGEAGGMVADFDQSNSSGAGWSQGGTDGAWVVGAGLAYAFSDKWFARVAYRYADFDSETYTPTNGIFAFNLDRQMHQVRASLSYRFGGGGY